MRPLFVVLIVQLAIGAGFLALVAVGGLPFADGDSPATEKAAQGVKADRFDERRAFAWLKRQVALGPRPAGSPASRRLAGRLRAALPEGRYAPVPGGLRNVVGRVRGRERRRFVVVGAHYDTKDIPGFVGANDAASGTAVVLELARAIRARPVRPTVVFILFDGEESPAGAPDSAFEELGLRGSKAAAPRYREAEAMILLDFVGERDLRIPREGNSNEALWARLRAAARRVGFAATFPPETYGPISDDHVPFLREGVPAIDLIDFDFPCFHKTCDDLSVVSARSLDAAGETVLELLRRL